MSDQQSHDKTFYLAEIESEFLMVGVGHVHADGVEAVPWDAAVPCSSVEIEKINVTECQPLQFFRDSLEIKFLYSIEKIFSIFPP